MSAPDPFRRFDLAALRRRTSMKWRTHPPDVLPCWVAEMDVELAPAVIEAVTTAMATGDTGYPVGRGYAEALAGFAAERWGWTDLDPAASVLVPDVMRGAVAMLDLFSAPGDTVVVNTPAYPPFFEFVRHSGRNVATAPLGTDGRLDLDTLAAAFAAATGPHPAYLLCSPHNPTGTVHTAAELSAVADLAAHHGVRVIADEIHAPLAAADVTFVPYLTVPGTDDAFALHSASKGWNLAGLKAAVAIAGRRAVADLARVPFEVTVGASHVGVLAHIAAFTDGGAWLDTVVAGLDRHRALLVDLLAAHLPAVVHVPAQATYLAWLDCRALDLGNDPAAVFLERGRVALTPGPPFTEGGPGGAGFARLNIGAAPELLTEAVRRMAAALA